MPFNRPTLQTHIDRIEGALASGMSILGPVLRRSMVRVLGRAIAGAVHLMHGHIAHQVRQHFVKFADRENLIAMAEEDGVDPIQAATFASGLLTVFGANGTILPGGTIWTLGALQYETQADVTISGGTATPEIECTVAGAEGNLGSGQTLTIATAITGIGATASTGIIDGGTDEEELEDFRARYLEALRGESLGGSDDDWIRWAKEVPGVTRAWVYRHEDGLGTVTIRFVRDNDGDGADIIPSAPEVATVQDKFLAERPTTSEPTAAAPTAAVQAFTIALGALDTAANRLAIRNELIDLYFRKAEPGDGDARGTIYLEQMQTAIGNVVTTYELTNPTVDFVPTLGQLGIVDPATSITWA